MVFPTRIVTCVLQYVSLSKYKFLYLQKHFAIMFCLLLMGFVVGNMFGTFLSLIRNFIIWDGLLIICFLFIFEIFSYAIYHSKERIFGFFLLYPQLINKSIWRFANFFKIGLMIGFFIDAFKVGS